MCGFELLCLMALQVHVGCRNRTKLCIKEASVVMDSQFDLLFRQNTNK